MEPQAFEHACKESPLPVWKNPVRRTSRVSLPAEKLLHFTYQPSVRLLKAKSQTEALMHKGIRGNFPVMTERTS